MQDGTLYRQINPLYKVHYDHLMNSGLYNKLVDVGLLIPHDEVSGIKEPDCEAYKIIKPALIPFVSYPYEWSFGQLKDAAIAFLEAEEIALAFGMTLKDASAYNIQFRDCKPVLIDTLSFEKYEKEKPWVAYRQFCQHFIAPLALMSYVDIRLSQLLKANLDGIPLDLASAILPRRTYLRPSLFMHIHMHAKFQNKYRDKRLEEAYACRLDSTGLRALIDSLKSTVASLCWKPPATPWSHYTKDMIYPETALSHKKKIVSELLDRLNPKILWDIGANTGVFSRISSAKGISTISLDMDPACVEENYSACRKSSAKNILPLILDITNPSPGIGWNNHERPAFLERGTADVALVLALIHHLVVTNNLPLSILAEFFQKICVFIIIEFIPRSDRQMQKMLSGREEEFAEYTQENFEKEFQKHFELLDRIKIDQSDRAIYFMKRKTC